MSNEQPGPGDWVTRLVKHSDDIDAAMLLTTSETETNSYGEVADIETHRMASLTMLAAHLNTVTQQARAAGDDVHHADVMQDVLAVLQESARASDD